MSSFLSWLSVVLITTVTNSSTTVYNVCQSYKTLSDPWRNTGFKSNSFPGWPMNDHNIQQGWYRFIGIGGDVLNDFCVTNSSGSNMILSLGPCSGLSTMSSDSYAETCHLGISYSFGCIYAQRLLKRAFCGEFYLYYLDSFNGCFSTRHSYCSASSCGPNAYCNASDGSCVCDSGFSIPDGFLPTGDSYGCSRANGLNITVSGDCKTNATLDCTNNLLSKIENITTQVFPQNVVKDTLEFLTDKSLLVGEASQEERISSFNALLRASEKVVSTLVMKTETNYSVSFSLQTTEVRVFVVGPNCNLKKNPQLVTADAQMDIDLIGISKNDLNGGHAAVTFMSYTNISNSSLFSATTDTMALLRSAVVSATLSKTNYTKLTKPVNFTLKHTAELNSSGTLSCVYWKEKEWVVDGCTYTKVNSSHAVCSCTHLSTFALIMQTNPQECEETDDVLELINMVALTVGLVCLVLALLTFFFCRRNPRVTKTARINLCISLLSAHLLFLLTQEFLQYIQPHQVVCAVLAGVLHFLFLSAFVWMSIEAVLLFISVKNLSRLSKKEVLGWKPLTAAGYTIALVVVGVSAGVASGGYGSKQCWLKKEKYYTWSFLGPVCFMLASNVILFSLIANSLRSSLTRLNSQVSQIKQTRIVVFKTVVQFFILGCPWILGFFTDCSKVLLILFVFLNSQQGTFIFLIHCVLNKEVRQEYRKLLCDYQPGLSATTMTEVQNPREGNAS
ncbi:adhesion G protein-coupled receptor E3-like isoform X2 [Salminus brasiliensis]|uniref:adhesion G protein-coupled receptor E3-like isoform X2 n=1 Tax=Salminus brasiliensis TaxID=930266 RepID=UPI003B8379E7